jgi:lipopolysaccharide biosynthesis glycosyltransferase
LEQLANQPIESLALPPSPANKFCQWTHYIDKNIYEFNLGTLVFNLQKWYEIPLQNLMTALMKENKSNLVFTDKDILNSIIRKYIQQLNPIFLLYTHLTELNLRLFFRLLGFNDQKIIKEFHAVIKHPITVAIITTAPVYGYEFYSQLEGNLNLDAPKWHTYFRATPFYGQWTPPLGNRVHAWTRYIPRILRTVLATLYSYLEYFRSKNIHKRRAKQFQKGINSIDPEHKYFIG